MQKIRNAVTSAPKAVASHVYRNRGRYGIVTGIIVGGVAVRHLDNETYKEAIAFIESKGLSDEFFLAPEDLADLA